MYNSTSQFTFPYLLNLTKHKCLIVTSLLAETIVIINIWGYQVQKNLSRSHLDYIKSVI